MLFKGKGRSSSLSLAFLPSLTACVSAFSFFLAEDSAQAAKDHEQVIKALADSPASVAKIEKFFFDTTRELIEAESYSPVVGKIRNVNLVRDVLKYVPLQWAATEIV